MVSFKPRPYLLINKIQPYAWGTRGKEAFIPRFLGMESEKDRPYAELWMGTHPKAPSDVMLDGSCVPLPQLISRYPLEILGRTVAARFSGQFPFLFKVLSAAEALSIQAHPDKKQAEFLHARDPEHYPDDNHKPEIAIALDSLTALIGFKRPSDIAEHGLAKYPELADFIGQENVSGLRNLREPFHFEEQDVLRTAYSALMRRSIARQEELGKAIDQLGRRLSESTDALLEEERIFLELRKKYPADVGLISIFLLNLIHLEKGQGVFIGPGIPHAYLKGNIVECMATSDNVVRAGLTWKFKDVETLLDILSYDTQPVSVLGGNLDRPEVVYQTPATEFQVSRWTMIGPHEEKKVVVNSPQVLLVTKGNCLISWGSGSQSGQEEFQQGQSVLIPAFLKEFTLLATTSLIELFKVEVPL